MINRRIFIILLLALSMTLPALAQEETEDILPITEDINYTVRVADTLDKIGALFDVQSKCIAQRNDIKNPGRIKVDDILKITVDCPPYDGELAVVEVREVVTAEDTCPDGYVVQKSDTLDGIALAFDVSLQSLQLENDAFTARDVTIGMCLTIPTDAPAYGVVPALDEGDGQGGGVEGERYVIQPGDTLDRIGQEFNVSVVSLRRENVITRPGDMHPGKVIVIPENAPAYGTYPALCLDETGIPAITAVCDSSDGQGGGIDGEAYIVQVGDTLNRIGAQFNADIACIVEENELSNSRIFAGQTLIIGSDCPAYTGDFVITPLKGSIAPADEAEGEDSE